MGPLLLLTSTLLSSYFQPGRAVDVQPSFTIRNINLAIEPSTDVARGTNVTVRCRAIVSSSGEQALSRAYTICKDSTVVYTKNTSSSEDLVYPLFEARVSNTGKYMCKIDIGGKQMSSTLQKLTVTGLSAPVLKLNKGVLSEGEEVTARCTAPEETGSIIFYFYVDSKEFLEVRVKSNQAEAKIRFRTAGIHRVHCDYTVLITPDAIKSEESSSVTVSVKELSITPVLDIVPQRKIYEGDRVIMSCTIWGSLYNPDSVYLFLSRGTQLLNGGNIKVNYSMIALAEDSGEFECRLEMGNVAKVATKTISVTELFSVPTLTVSPAEVFKGDDMNLTCRSENFASERVREEEVSYSIYPGSLTRRGPGVFFGKTLPYDFNYTCTAQAKGIVKKSRTLTIRPKVPVSMPKISVFGKAILGRPFQILCHSDTGSLPIKYTLWSKYDLLNITTVSLPDQKALFTVTIQKPDEIKQFMCEAQNNNRYKDGILSKRLDGTVTVPLSEPTLTVLPDLGDITEGAHLYLICGVSGTPPVTYRWYRTGNPHPLFTTTSHLNSSDYQIPRLGSDDSGTYYCEAINHANNIVRSPLVAIEVRMALWKKGVIVASCLLVVAVLVLLCVLRFRAKRVRVDKAANSVWSERPPNAASDEESSVASSEPDVEYTEVVHPQPADPARVPLRKGTDTVYSELQNSPHGAADHHDYGSVEYADLNAEQLEISPACPEVNNHQDLPVPVD